MIEVRKPACLWNFDLQSTNRYSHIGIFLDDNIDFAEDGATVQGAVVFASL